MPDFSLSFKFQYWVMLFDHFAGTYALMGVAFFEVLAVIYVYGWQKLAFPLELIPEISIVLILLALKLIWLI